MSGRLLTCPLITREIYSQKRNQGSRIVCWYHTEMMHRLQYRSSDALTCTKNTTTPIAKVEDSTEQRSEHLPVNRRWQNLVLRQYCMYIERWCTDLVRIEALTRIIKHNGPDHALSSWLKKRGPKMMCPERWFTDTSFEALTQRTIIAFSSLPKKIHAILGSRIEELRAACLSL
jgi:hypothetical protein